MIFLDPHRVAAFFILGESITGAPIAAGALILLDVWMVNKRRSSLYYFM